jgi:hypothetical protein
MVNRFFRRPRGEEEMVKYFFRSLRGRGQQPVCTGYVHTVRLRAADASSLPSFGERAAAGCVVHRGEVRLPLRAEVVGLPFAEL